MTTFIWIPKTGGTTVTTVLDAKRMLELDEIKPAGGIVTYGHMDYGRLVAEGIVPKADYTFAFVRNPFARAVSLWAYIRSGKNRSVLASRDSLSPETTFLDFCRHLHEIESIGLYNTRGLSQCNPQVRWIENVEIDHLGRTETLVDDLRVICRAIGRPAPPVLPRLNVSVQGGWKEHYCTESREIIEDIYAEDFAVLGYAVPA